jgi:hypothetical protein
MARGVPIQQVIEDLDPSTVQAMVTSLKQLHDLGKPETDEEVEERIKYYFEFCEQSGLRPGVESLAAALHISRQTLFYWSNGTNCSPRRTEAVQSAKALISAFLEQCVMSGKISPPSGIFLMKNWLSYKDTVSIEEATPTHMERKPLTAADLPRLGAINSIEEGKSE